MKTTDSLISKPGLTLCWWWAILAIYTYGKSTLEDASYNGLSLIYASELEAKTL